MVKLLRDICLSVIQRDLDKVKNVRNLPTLHKEMLLERLGWHDMLTKSYLPHVAYNLFSKSLRKINFYNCDQINDNLLKLLQSAECKIEFLTLEECVNVTDEGVHNITRNQDELVVVKIQKMKQLTDNALKCIQSESLKLVDLRNSYGFTFKGVAGLSERNRNIQELHLWGIAEMLGSMATNRKSQDHNESTHEYIINTAYNLGKNLVVLVTKLNQMCDDCLIAVAHHCPNLKRLNIHGSSRISGEALTKFSMGCTSLSNLDLSFCTMLSTSPSVEALWTLPTSLTELSLTGIVITDETIFVECLQRLRNLKEVRLCGVPSLSDDTLTQVLKSIGHSLTLLDLSGSVASRITDKGLEAVTDYCYNLEALFVSLLVNVTCEGLLPLIHDPVRASKLRKLSSTIRNLDEQVLLGIVECCNNLERLDLSGVQSVTDSTVITLAHNSTTLKEFSIKGCRQVTDRGVCELVRCCALESLVISGVNNLTDLSIFALANSCHYLKEIYMTGCAKISPVAVRYLIDCTIPRLYVNHVTPNAAPNQLMARNLDTGEFCRADLLPT